MKHHALTISLLVSLAACRSKAPVPPIDPAMAACIPNDIRGIAGIRLDAVRSFPQFARLRDKLAATPLLADATFVFGAWDGTEVLVAARGKYQKAPAGATLAGSGLVLAGAPSLVAQALDQIKSPRPNPLPLVEHAASLAGSWPVWMALTGGHDLPLHGNAANFNRLLMTLDFLTIGIRPGANVDFTALGECSSAKDAARLEEMLRALVTIIGAAGPPDSDAAQIQRQLKIARKEKSVTAGFTIPEALAGRLLDTVLTR